MVIHIIKFLSIIGDGSLITATSKLFSLFNAIKLGFLWYGSLYE